MTILYAPRSLDRGAYQAVKLVLHASSSSSSLLSLQVLRRSLGLQAERYKSYAPQIRVRLETTAVKLVLHDLELALNHHP